MRIATLKISTVPLLPQKRCLSAVTRKRRSSDDQSSAFGNSQPPSQGNPCEQCLHVQRSTVTEWSSTGCVRTTAQQPWLSDVSISIRSPIQDVTQQENQTQLEYIGHHALSLGHIQAHITPGPHPLQRTGPFPFIQQKQDWEFIASMVSGSTWQKCKFRWLGLKKVRLITHKWSKIESRLLAQAVAEQTKIHWKLVSERLYERNPSKSKVFRTAKQCREHWNCFLNPNIHKGPWEPQEDRRLLEYVLELEGAKKWS